jgi:G3E family GTPase
VRRPTVAPAAGLEHADAQPGYATWSRAGEAPLHGKALCDALIALPEDVLRAKGILHPREDTTHRYVVQLVGRRWSIERDRQWNDETPGSRVVLIGLPASIDAGELAGTMTRLSEPD